MDNKTMMTNHRSLSPITTEVKLGRAVHAPALLPAVVAYLARWAELSA
jgi:hypothetical protein